MDADGRKTDGTPAWARGVAYVFGAILAALGVGLLFAVVGGLYWLGGKGFGLW